MDYQTFRASLTSKSPPEAISNHLLALWHDAQGNWELAHECVQSESDPLSARIHAYLHRKEGDILNARYWYNRCGEAPFSGSLSDEWNTLVQRIVSVSRAA